LPFYSCPTENNTHFLVIRTGGSEREEGGQSLQWEHGPEGLILCPCLELSPSTMILVPKLNQKIALKFSLSKMRLTWNLILHTPNPGNNQHCSGSGGREKLEIKSCLPKSPAL
jgi:hypothetical protein